MAPPAAKALASSMKLSPLLLVAAVCSVCLSEPEQADVPQNSVCVATSTSTLRRLSSTAARRPAAPLPSTSAWQR